MSRRTTLPTRPTPQFSIGSAFTYGCFAGLLGVAVMTAGEKIEQTFTSRPNSYVPGYTLQRLLGLSNQPGRQPFGLNMVMHYGQGALAGGVRGVMSLMGVRGPFADFMFTAMRLMVDQTLENVTGVGALPWTWPVGEQVVDVLHKGVYAFVTGYLADRWIQ